MTAHNVGLSIVSLIFVVGVVFLWISPILVAQRRNIRNQTAVTVLALLGVCGGITWVIAMILALADERRGGVNQDATERERAA